MTFTGVRGRMRAMLLGAALFVVACDDAEPPIGPGGDADGVGELAGVVTLEQRAPVEGATIRLHGAGDVIEGSSDASGEFELDEIPVGTYSVEVIPPGGLALRTLDQSSVTLGDGDRVELTIDMGAAASTGSLVVEIVHDAAPVADLAVTVLKWGPALDTLAMDTVGRGVTDANGQAMFQLDDGMYAVLISSAPGLFPVNGALRYHVPIVEGAVRFETFELVEFDNPPPSHETVDVTARAFLNESSALAGVHIEMHREDLTIDATTDAEGYADLGELLPGAYLVQVEAPAGYSLADGQPAEWVHYLLDTDSTAFFTVAIANEEGDGLLSTLVWGDSVFIQGAQLTVYEQGTSNVVAQGTTEANGRWNPLIQPGTYRVVLTVPGGWTLMNGGSATQENIVVNAGRRTYSSFYLTQE